jgi:hypothetical protein
MTVSRSGLTEADTVRKSATPVQLTTEDLFCYAYEAVAIGSKRREYEAVPLF